MPRNPTEAMWTQALSALARTERLHREAFRPAPRGWEPPVDLLETDDALIIVAALPGVAGKPAVNPISWSLKLIKREGAA